jgi:hypothetical protein
MGRRLNKLIDAAVDTALVTGGTVAGAGTGATVTAVLGGMGLAIAGTAVALPIVAVGAGAGLLAGGVAVLSRRYLGCRGRQDSGPTE